MDIPAIREQLEALHVSAYGWALHCCGHDREITEDVLQAAYLEILEGKAAFDGRSGFKTWLFAVIRNIAREESRKNTIMGLRFSFLNRAHDHQTEHTIEDSIYQSEREAMFRRAFGRLPQRQREVLHLVFYQDLTIEESADALGISIGSARAHYDRGKKRLRKELSSMEEFSDERTP